MNKPINRREFLRLAGLGGGVVFASGLSGCSLGGQTLAPAASTNTAYDDFYFVQMSDTHWGFEGALNPDARNTLGKAVAAANDLAHAPDFIIFTGDLTHTTDDPQQRRVRMAQFREIVAGLKTQKVLFMPGEHDASLDRGEAYKEFFGDLHYTFDHKGVHFIALDNVSDPGASIGESQLAWLAADLQQQSRDARIVVFAHRPLYDLYPQWDWATRDGAKAIELLMPYSNVTVFHGHIHQEHHHMTGHIAHHSAKSLIFPFPAPGSQSKRTPLPWDASQPHRGLGIRQVEAETGASRHKLEEYPVKKG